MDDEDILGSDGDEEDEEDGYYPGMVSDMFDEINQKLDRLTKALKPEGRRVAAGYFCAECEFMGELDAKGESDKSDWCRGHRCAVRLTSNACDVFRAKRLFRGHYPMFPQTLIANVMAKVAMIPEVSGRVGEVARIFSISEVAAINLCHVFGVPIGGDRAKS